MEYYNPFNCKMVKELYKDAQIVPQCITMKDNTQYCFGFKPIDLVKYRKCGECEHFLYNTPFVERAFRHGINLEEVGVISTCTISKTE